MRIGDYYWDWRLLLGLEKGIRCLYQGLGIGIMDWGLALGIGIKLWDWDLGLGLFMKNLSK